ncbi:P27 family phage terminase small subunit [Paenibacillus glycanilyticus]|uniref:P27 family phage terminase small subunit n=1 Tax=Paenibacillus glycanilyticus TaxID=126569 RepID=UPI00203EBBA0|nr:P27 family phage terminase small subunit [Paenibacillus glycanilyticus]MCM3628794.1 P27 family phage terminase small subunit [Paenibacillus glycanilyticus]
MDEKELKSLKKELMSRIDKKSKLQIEKVERYINLVSIFYLLDKSIKEQGVMTVTTNGSQSFTKANPALAEKSKINASLISLYKDLSLDSSPSPTSVSDDKSKSDLI